MKRRVALCTTLLALGAGAGAGNANGAVVSGSDLSAAANTTFCEFPFVPTTCTMAISSLPAERQAAGGPQAAIDGVIVSWSLRSGANAAAVTVRLHVVRDNAGVAIGASEVLPTTAGVYSFPARMTVRAGDRIGIDAETAPFSSIAVVNNTSSGGSFDLWVPQLAPTETRSPNLDDYPGYELLVNATIEADADEDGFGDETQDQCPNDGTTQGACPPAPPPPVTPDTRVKGPKGTIHKTRATFRFSSTVAAPAFQCRLDKKPFRACRSPKTYKGLAEGKHVFKVRAVGPTGLTDPKAAKRTFRVEL
jgi:hypothetical protein